MGIKLVRFLTDNAEDVALLGGVLFFAVGVGITFGIGPALIAFGIASVAYGIWITPRGH